MRDRECPFSEDVIVDETGAVDPNPGMMAKDSSLIEVQRLGGSYELDYLNGMYPLILSRCIN